VAEGERDKAKGRAGGLVVEAEEAAVDDLMWELDADDEEMVGEGEGEEE